MTGRVSDPFQLLRAAHIMNAPGFAGGWLLRVGTCVLKPAGLDCGNPEGARRCSVRIGAQRTCSGVGERRGLPRRTDRSAALRPARHVGRGGVGQAQREQFGSTVYL